MHKYNASSQKHARSDQRGQDSSDNVQHDDNTEQFVGAFPFLLLPSEIRGQVYKEVLSFLTTPKTPSSSFATAAYLTHRTTSFQASCPNTGVCLPRSPPPTLQTTGVVSLHLTCRQIQTEMMDAIRRAYSYPSSAEGIDAKTEAHLELLATPTDIAPRWLSIPPVHLWQWKAVVVHLTFVRRVKGWFGNGGPNKIGHYLLVLLGDFLQHGPSFSPGGPVAPSIALEKIILLVDESYVSPGMGMKTTEEKKVVSSAIIGLKGYLQMITLSGLLYGKIKYIRMVSNGDEEAVVEWEVKRVDDDELLRETAKLWAGYGWSPGRYVETTMPQSMSHSASTSVSLRK